MKRSLRTELALRAGRLAGALSRAGRVGAGVTIGGRVALALAPGALAELAGGRVLCSVSGTNGKTTTTRLIAAALRASGRAVTSNTTGANLASGLVSALSGSPDPAVLEVDEAVLPRAAAALDPSLMVLTNLSRDQLDRYGEVGTVAGRWREMLALRPGQRVVANLRDPFVVWAAQPARALWVDTGMTWREDATVCPACGSLLEWRDGWFGSACGFEQPPADAVLRDGVFTMGSEQVALSLALPGRWNEANAAMALAAATELGVGLAGAAEAVAGVGEVAGRQATWRLPDGREARLLLAKNPAGWTEVLAYLAATGSGVVIALNCRIADGRDPSWLWDVPFELLAAAPAGPAPGPAVPMMVAASGERFLDLAVRLRYAGVDFALEADPMAAAAKVGGDRVDIVATYTAFVGLLRRLGHTGVVA